MKKVRASLGTLGVLGMELIKMDAPPTTAYLQIYTDKRCEANCLFCAQASGSNADLCNIARGIYIPADRDEIVRRLGIAYEKGYLKRACIQTILYGGWWQDVIDLVSGIRATGRIPVSVSIPPQSLERLGELKESGADHVTIPLDACTADIFERIKGAGAGGPYRWESHIRGLKNAVSVFGKGNTGTHLIIGLSESDEEAIRIINYLHDTGIQTALFAYTHIAGTRPVCTETGRENSGAIRHFRTVQLARYLINENIAGFDDMLFEGGTLIDFGIDKKKVISCIESGEAFMTAGCPGCNRPLATETFEKMYNFPGMPGKKDIDEIKRAIGL